MISLDEKLIFKVLNLLKPPNQLEKKDTMKEGDLISKIEEKKELWVREVLALVEVRRKKYGGVIKEANFFEHEVNNYKS